MTYLTHWFRGRQVGFEEHTQKLKDASSLEFLEIGCWEGEATNWMLETFPQANVTVVDPFTGNPEHIQKGLYDLGTLKDRFIENTKAHASRVTINQGASVDVLPRLIAADLQFDLIYVDGSHTAYDVFSDAADAWRLLKPGGILAFDDYLWRPDLPETERPKIAIDAFFRAFDGKYKLLLKRGYVILERL